MLFIIPLIGALIGYITNKLAIKLIFRPYDPIKIPIVNFKFQGLLPKRRDIIAQDIGLLIEKDLLPVEDIFKKLNRPEFQKKITDSLSLALYTRLIARFPIELPKPLQDVVFHQVQDVVKKEGPILLNKTLEDVKENINEEIAISELVKQKVDSFDIKRLESLLMVIVKTELKHIEILGGILGFIIGLIQVLLILTWY